MTKAEIRTQFLAILNRSDCTNALADTFIERGITKSQRTLRVPALERTDEITIGAVFDGLDIPNDFIAPIAVYRTSSSDSYKLERVSLAEYLDHPSVAGNPNVWTRKGSKLLLKPTPSENDVIMLLYYGEFEAFTGDSDEIPMSIIVPELFYYGGLLYAADYFLDDRKSLWEQTYNSILLELQAQADDEELSGGAVTQPAYNFPSEDF